MAPVLTESDRAFATVGEATLRLDLYRAPPTDAPVVLYLHGGGWRSGDKADGATERLAALAAYGVTVASIEYRLVPAATFPDQVHDVKGAVLLLGGARHEGPEFDRPANLALTAAWLRANLTSPTPADPPGH
jgi:acetyl esterase/lipase